MGVEKLLSISAFYENKCLENIKELYKYSSKCDDKHKYKDIIEEVTVFTSE